MFYAAAVCALIAPAVLEQQSPLPETRVIVSDRTPRPGALSSRICPFTSVATNNRGDVLFESNDRYDGEGQREQPGLWVLTENATRLVLRAGVPAPGVPLSTVSDVGFFRSIDNRGRVSFQARLRNEGLQWEGSERTVVYFDRGEGPRPIAVEGEEAPGTAGGVYRWIGRFGVDSNGRLALGAGFLPADAQEHRYSNEGIWTFDDALNPRLLVSTGSVAPGTTTRFEYLEGGTGVSGPDASRAFSASLVDDANFLYEGIWVAREGGNEALRVAGDPVNAGDPQRFRYLGPPRVNRFGEVFFRGGVSAPGEPDDAIDFGVWLAIDGHVRQIVRAGDRLPGSRYPFRSSWRSDRNDRGDIALFAFNAEEIPDQGPFDFEEGLWLGRPGDLRAVAKSGDRAIGFDGMVYRDFLDMLINARGDVLFWVSLARPGAFATDEAYFLYDARLDTVYPVLSRETRAIDEDGAPAQAEVFFTEMTRAFNDAGQVVAPAFVYSDAGFGGGVILVTPPGRARPCSADLDRDNDVDLADFAIFARAFNRDARDASYEVDTDFDYDAHVDLGDFGVFPSQFGNTAAECDP